MTASNYFLGLDLGQAADWSALAVLERSEMPAPQNCTGSRMRSWRLGCRGLKRWRLGTSYPGLQLGAES